jgi:hypothetical protein
MKLLILFGPPAVGKTTIGSIIESKTDFKLFHNHMVMDGIMHIFGVGTAAEDKLSKIVRTNIIQEAAENNMDLIFTYVWNFGKEKGRINIDSYKEIYESRGGEVVFIELSAPLDVRSRRADSPERHALKANAPDSQRVRHLEAKLSFQSPVPFFYPDLSEKVETNDRTPLEIADEIIKRLS